MSEIVLIEETLYPETPTLDYKTSEPKTFKDVYRQFSSIDVMPFSDKKKSKDARYQFDYINWAIAYELLMKHCQFEVHRETLLYEGQPLFPIATGKGFYVKTRLTIDGFTREETLPLFERQKEFGMVSLLQPDSFQVNTALQRCFVKNAAMFGFGIQHWSRLEREFEILLNTEQDDMDNDISILKEDPTDSTSVYNRLFKPLMHAKTQDDLNRVAQAIKTAKESGKLKTEQLDTLRALYEKLSEKIKGLCDRESFTDE